MMRIFVLIIILTAASPCAWAQSGSQIRQDIAYGPSSQEVLDLCLPANGAGPFPGIINIHGGGWAHGDKRGQDKLCKDYAAHGFVVANIDYRLVDPLDTSTQWPAQLEDVQLAVRWMRANAQSIELDPRHICSAGDSAGGHLALFLGSLPQIEPGDRADLLPQIPPNVECVVDKFGPADLTTPPVKQNRIDLLGGATPESNHALYIQASPIFRVTANSAPTLIIQGDEDRAVLPIESEKLLQAMQQNGVKVQIIRYHGGHEFKGLSAQERAQIRAQEISFLQSILQ